MNARVFDRQDDRNPMNGSMVTTPSQVRSIISATRGRAPFFAELIGDNGATLLLGLGGTDGCAQFSATDGSPPYLMAVAPTPPRDDASFLIGGTPSPVLARYLFPYEFIERIAVAFLATGQPMDGISWEEI